MARVPYLDQQDLAAEHRDLLKRSVNIVRALANSPNGLREFSALSNFIRFKSRLDPRLRELAILMVGYLTRSPYEWSHHVEIGRRFGVSDADIRALMDEAGGRPSDLEPLAKTVLKAASEMTRDLAVSDVTFAELRAGLDTSASSTWSSPSPSTTPSCACWRACRSMWRATTSAISTSSLSRPAPRDARPMGKARRSGTGLPSSPANLAAIVDCP